MDGALLVVDDHSRVRLYRVALPWDRAGRAARVAELTHAELVDTQTADADRRD